MAWWQWLGAWCVASLVAGLLLGPVLRRARLAQTRPATPPDEGEGPACGMPAAVPALAALAVVLVVTAVALLA